MAAQNIAIRPSVQNLDIPSRAAKTLSTLTMQYPS